MVRLNRQLCSVPGSGCPGHFLDKKDLSSLSSYRDNTIPYLSAALSAHIPGCPPPSAGYTQPTCLTLPCIPVSWVTIASAGLPSGSLSAQQILFRWLKKKKKLLLFSLSWLLTLQKGDFLRKDPGPFTEMTIGGRETRRVCSGTQDTFLP